MLVQITGSTSALQLILRQSDRECQGSRLEHLTYSRAGTGQPEMTTPVGIINQHCPPNVRILSCPERLGSSRESLLNLRCCSGLVELQIGWYLIVPVADRQSTSAQLRKLLPPFAYLNVTLAATTIGLRLGLRQLLLPRWTTTKSANAREIFEAIFGLRGETTFPCSFNTAPLAIVTPFFFDHIHVASVCNDRDRRATPESANSYGYVALEPRPSRRRKYLFPTTFQSRHTVDVTAVTSGSKLAQFGRCRRGYLKFWNTASAGRQACVVPSGAGGLSSNSSQLPSGSCM